MSTYTHKNLGDLEDMAAKHGAGSGFSARFAGDALECQATGLALESLAPGARAPFAHKHTNAEEVYVILAGGGRMLVGDDIVDVATHDAVRVSPDVIRSFEAGPEGLQLLVFGPRHKGDGEILSVEWPGQP